jgi:Cu2+-exporting ATPase
VVVPIDEATFKVGFGLIVQVGAHTIHVGSARFMTGSEIALPPELVELQATSQQQGKLCVWVARDGLVIGVLILKAPLRPESRAIIEELRRSTKIRTVLLVSGDQPTPTQQAALAVGADGFYAEILPVGKAELIARLQAEGRKVCFIGDGINDAIALKQANVSVSMVGSTQTAIDTAHIVLMEEGLERLPLLFKLARNVADTQRMMMIPVLGTSVVGVIGIFAWGWGLTMSTVLDQAGMIGGTIVLLRQRIRSQRQLQGSVSAAPV